MSDHPDHTELSALLAHELGRRSAFEPDWYDGIQESFLTVCEMVSRAVREGRTVFVCGNGGSAAQAQHFAAELVGRFKRERGALPSAALTTDTSALTAIGNDYGFEEVFRRQAEALMRAGDVLIGLSTSGDSPNVVGVLEWAREEGMSTVALTGEGGGRMAQSAEVCVSVPSRDTDLIQEKHLVLLHILAETAERSLTSAG
ncbi:MAG: SIS domain-containing protein [bacterium]